uniref:Uncharacterized protein n=1 Tax=Octopus bimaculoides TaxID=37653 RepID=A0A0L8GF74_OCTBM
MSLLVIPLSHRMFWKVFVHQGEPTVFEAIYWMVAVLCPLYFTEFQPEHICVREQLILTTRRLDKRK